MEKLEEEIKNVPQMCEKTKDSQIKGKRQSTFLSEAMVFMTNKFEEYERGQQGRRIKLQTVWKVTWLI